MEKLKFYADFLSVIHQPGSASNSIEKIVIWQILGHRQKVLCPKKGIPASIDAGIHFKITQKEVKYWSSKNGA